jgi:hypothetical protein
MSRKREPKERIARRVREFRKRQQAELNQQNVFIWGVKNYFREHGLTTEWVLASNVYDGIEILKITISFERFIAAIRGTENLTPVRSIELTKLYDERYATTVWLVRPLKIPKTRKRKEVSI